MAEQEFQEKFFYAAKIGKMYQKWAENRVFKICWQILLSTNLLTDFTEFVL